MRTLLLEPTPHIFNRDGFFVPAEKFHELEAKYRVITRAISANIDRLDQGFVAYPAGVRRLSRLLSTRKRAYTRRKHSVYLILILSYLSFQVFTARVVQLAPKPVKKNCGLEALPWVSERTVKFTHKWTNHKTRNAAAYLCVSTRKCPLLNALVYRLLVCPDVFYEDRHEKLFEVPALCIRHSCLKRFGRSHYVYAEFILSTFEPVTRESIQPPRPTPNGKIAVIVEPRKHPLLEYTIKQVMTTLGQTWSLQLFVSDENEDWIRHRLQIHGGGCGENIVVTSLAMFGLNEMSRFSNKVQSAFSAHSSMYEAIRSEHILWFQVDVVLRAKPQPDWLQFAYIGSEWHGCEYPTCSVHNCDKVCGGGNSGLSLRRRSKLQAIATRGHLPEYLWGRSSRRYTSVHVQHYFDHDACFESDEFRDNSVTRWFQDDLQLSFKLSKLALLPPANVSRHFAIGEALPKNESVLEVNPSGMHKPWSTPWIHPEIIMELLSEPFHHIMRSTGATP